jgi:hypothetical protein
VSSPCRSIAGARQVTPAETGSPPRSRPPIRPPTCGDGVILIQTEVGKAAQVAKDIVDITGVQQAQAVAGPLRRDRPRRGTQHRRARQAGFARVQAVDGITTTLTCPVVHL